MDGPLVAASWSDSKLGEQHMNSCSARLPNHYADLVMRTSDAGEVSRAGCEFLEKTKVRWAFGVVLLSLSLSLSVCVSLSLSLSPSRFLCATTFCGASEAFFLFYAVLFLDHRLQLVVVAAVAAAAVVCRVFERTREVALRLFGPRILKQGAFFTRQKVKDVSKCTVEGSGGLFFLFVLPYRTVRRWWSRAVV